MDHKVSDRALRDVVFYAVDEQMSLLKTQDLDFGSMIMPFGKYKGLAMYDTPLRYLDQTISPMDCSWFVRRVRRFVDAAIEELGDYGIWDLSGLAYGLPDNTWTNLEAMSNDKLSQSAAAEGR